MSDKEIDIEMETVNATGEVKHRGVQQNRRVSLPRDFLNQLGLEVGDDIFVVCGRDDTIHLVNSKEKAKDMSEKARRLK